MKFYYDHTPQNSFVVSNEYQRIENAKCKLNYVPLFGTVSIVGFRETMSYEPQVGEFYVDYHNDNNSSLFAPEIWFNPSDNGKHINVSYRGVPAVIQGKDVGEIRNFVVNGFTSTTKTVAPQSTSSSDVSTLFEKKKNRDGKGICKYTGNSSISDDEIASLFD